MARRSTGSARTAPKGRATPARNATTGRRRLFTPTVQWIVLVLIGAAIVGTVLYLLRDTTSNVGAIEHVAVVPAIRWVGSSGPGS
jgi:hypothetical protein